MEKDVTIGMQKITGLFDSGSFVEIGAYLKREQGDLTGAVCGYGAINGKLVYAFVQDSDREKGAFDSLQAKKNWDALRDGDEKRCPRDRHF